MKKPFENWKERIKDLPTLRFHAVDENAETVKMDLPANGASANPIMVESDGESPEGIHNNYERYQEFEELGVGGTGIVHSCKDPNLNRRVALKVLRYEHGADREQRTRFVREARVMAQLEHPNILPVHELGVRPDKTIYYSMKQINGKTLRDVLDGLIDGDPIFLEAFPLSQLLDIFQHVCHGMAFAHSRGVIHRDLKPDNILIGPFGEVLVMDWGLAKLVGEDDHRHVSRHSVEHLDKELDLEAGATTVDGEISGTPFYMAPEQATGKSSEMDQRTDIYSLGVILYEMLTLTRPIGGDSIKEILQNVIRGNIKPPRKSAPKRTIPPELDAVCMTALATRPGDRYDALSSLIADLEHFESGQEVSVYRGGVLRRAWKWCKRHPITSSATAAACLTILITTSAFGLIRHVRQTEFIKAGDREIANATTIQRDLFETLTTLQAIQSEEILKRESDAETEALARVEELERNMLSHLQQAEYLYSKGLRRTGNRIPEQIIALNRLKVGYWLKKKDFASLAQHMTYVKQNILPYMDEDYPQKELVERIVKVSEGKGSLGISSSMPGYHASLWSYQAGAGNILRPFFVKALGPTPVPTFEIEKGSYLLVFSPTPWSGQLTSLPPTPATGITYYPVKIDHAENQAVDVKLADQVPDGMVYVPGGAAYIGGVQSRNLRLHERNIPGFFMKQHEVTFEEYLEFWHAQDGGNMSPTFVARVRFSPDNYRYENAWDASGKLLSTLKLDRPIVGLSQVSAAAYCVWLSKRLNRAVRLPTAAEWEKAARGVDGRPFVWGTVDAPDLCYTFENVNARAKHGFWAPPGSFEHDVSVYGIYDLAGNVREWTSSRFISSPYYQIKGGSAALPRRFSYCSYSSDTPVVPSDVGFRYIMPLNE